MFIDNIKINNILYNDSTKDFYIVIMINNNKIYLLDTDKLLHIISVEKLEKNFIDCKIIETSIPIFPILSEIYKNKKYLIKVEINNIQYTYFYFRENIYNYILLDGQLQYYKNNINLMSISYNFNLDSYIKFLLIFIHLVQEINLEEMIPFKYKETDRLTIHYSNNIE